MAAGVIGNYCLRCRHKHMTMAAVKFVTVGSGNPTSVTDGSGVLTASTKVTRTATGTYRLNILDSWKSIVVPGPAIESTTDDDAVHLEAVSVTAGSNSVTVRLEQAGAAADITGTTVHVMLYLNPSDDS